jgi:hypothetical protein
VIVLLTIAATLLPFGAVTAYQHAFGSDASHLPALGRAFVVLWLLGWMTLGCGIIVGGTWGLLASDRITSGNGLLRVEYEVGRLGPSQEFRLEKVRSLRLAEVRVVSKGRPYTLRRVSFDYEGRVVSLRSSLSPAEGEEILTGPLGRMALGGQSASAHQL